MYGGVIGNGTVLLGTVHWEKPQYFQATVTRDSANSVAKISFSFFLLIFSILTLIQFPRIKVSYYFRLFSFDTRCAMSFARGRTLPPLF